MKQRHILLILLSLFVSVLQAATVNKQDALQKAQQFVAGRQAAARGGAGQAQSLQSALDNSYYYVFNIGTDGGFVIVSGDDRTPEILGYSDAGHFDAQNIPDNMRAFLQGYADEIQHMPETMPAASRGVGQKKVVRSSINPLIQTTWNQGRPYNNLCPMFLNTPDRCVTGCVATAMAQVMYYHSWPNQVANAIPAYQCSTNWTGYGRISVEGVPAGTNINWDDMWLDYPDHDENVAESSLSENEQTANAAVAQLMAYCGRSVQMNYGNAINGGSSASAHDVVGALVDYFDYDARAKYVERSSCGYADWIALIYNELAAGRPMIFGGQSTGGGHAFVCDGYDEDDFFHINWGWGGMSDGYFRLSGLTPDAQGAGGSSSSDGYNLSLGAIIGVQPDKGTPIDVAKLTVRNMKIMTNIVNNMAVTTDNHTYSRSNTSSNFYSTENNYLGFVSYFWNYTGSTKTFAYGWRLKKGGEIIQDFVASEGASINNNEMEGPGQTCSFGAGLEDGTYQIVAICKLSGTDSWVECIDADKYYIEADINGTSMTLNAIANAPAEYDIAVNSFSAGTLTVGQLQTITVSVTNSGAGDYHGDITLRFESSDTKFNFGGTTVDISAGETKDVSITAVPSAGGTFTVKIYDGLFDNGTLLANVSDVSVANGSSSADIAFSELAINNQSGDTVYGNAFSGSIKVTNNSGSAAYKQGISIVLSKTYNWQQTNAGWTYNYTTVGEKNVNDILASGSSKTIDFNFKGLEYGERYVLHAIYYVFNGSDMEGCSSKKGIYTIEHGFVTIDADGNVTATAPDANVTIPAEAVAVDLRGQSTITNVNAATNTNPNIVYLLDDNAEVPTGVTGNIVKGGAAETLSIVDGSNFSTPIAFSATQASYTRTFTLPATAAGGWSTLIVPFDVDKVYLGEEEIDWFHNAEATNGRFWVRKFVSDGNGSVAFDYTDRIKANTPYIIAVPGNAWGEKWSLVNKPIVFKGTNKEVATAKAVSSGNHYKFTGTTTQTTQEDVYTLNETGTTFVLGDATVSPFRAYFKAADLAFATSALTITSPSDIPTAIGQLPAEIATPAAMPKVVYTLDGRRVTSSQMKKGVYIVGGKKIIK